MTKSIKRLMFIVLTCVLLISSMCFLMSTNRAYASTAIVQSLAMEEGAGVRISSEDSGIKYTMIMSEADYGEINKKVSQGIISDVSYGILIAPAYYHKKYALNEENVFGASAKYNWAIDGKYTEEAGKVRITNLNTTVLGEYENGNVAMFASLVGIKDENIANEFIGVGYMKYTLDGKVKYDFTAENDNVRSMAYVAQAYIADNPGNANNATLQSMYLDKVANVASSYTTEYYLENAEGKFEKADTVVTESTIGATATLVQKDIPGYYFDSENENNSVATEVLANNKTVLKLYYKKAVLNADGSFYNSDFSLAHKLSASEFNVPYGWSYEGDNTYGSFQSLSNGKVGINTGWTPQYVKSIKLPFEANKPVSASVDAYMSDSSSYLNLYVYFYNANDQLIGSNSMSENKAISNTDEQTYRTSWFISPAETAYISMGIFANNNSVLYIDNAKLLTDTTKIYEDGSFFNSDFSLFTTPEESGLECNKPIGWESSTNAWGVTAGEGNVSLVEYGTITSPKFKVEAGTPLYVSAMAGDWNSYGSYLTFIVSFFDAQGNMLDSKDNYYGGIVTGWGVCNEYTSLSCMAPENTDYVQVRLQGLAYVYVDEVKIIIGESKINADGTFANSDFKLVNKPEGAECEKPVGWTYSHSSYDVQSIANNNTLMWNGTSVTSCKIKIQEDTKLYASVNVANWEGVTGHTLSFVISYEFYNANGELIETISSESVAVTNTDVAEWLNAQEVTSSTGTAFMRVKLSVTSSKVGYFYGVKLNVVA